jgi:hypothetical protein
MSTTPLPPTTSEGDVLAYIDNISVSWNAVESLPDDQHLALVNESNEVFLRAVAAIGELPKDPGNENLSELAQHIHRLDSKVNLLLELVGQLVYKHQDIPETSQVKLNSTHIQWLASELPEPGSVIFMKVYIQRGTPKPLCFYGNVVTDADEHRAGIARVRYYGLSGAVLDWLDKLIFRHHRRLVAHKSSVDSGRS